MMRRLISLLILIFLASGSFSVMQTHKALAVTSSDWQAGRIITDAVFTDTNALSVAQVQDFLNHKVGTGGYGRVAGLCDTNGVASSEYGGGTRAQYGAANGNSAPFTCLKDYYEVPKTDPSPGIPASNYGGAPIPAGARSAAQLIEDAAQRYNISPKVLLVTIQKESAGPLTTDDWPLRKQYTYAMGAHCPDSGPGGAANCDENYAGFSMQVMESARLFRYYIDNSSQPWWPYKKVGFNDVLYNPNRACGSATINISSVSTAALYTYTPYQPNQAALDNMYGSGDGCSAYGNRNFWRIFSDWFGSTSYADCIYPSAVKDGLYRLYNLNSGSHLLTSSPAEVCNATALGFRYDSQIFKAGSAGNIPVYRLEKKGIYLYTISPAERDFALQNYGFHLEGIAFNGADQVADPTNARPVYRLSNATGAYAYTISMPERDSLIISGYSYEGVGFYLTENPGATVTATYRLRNNRGAYLFTISAEERDIDTQYYGYRYEGVGFDAITQENPITLPIYRLETENGFLLTTSLSERVAAIKVGYKDKGISMFTYGDDPKLPKAFRLHNPNGSYLFTTSVEESDWAARNAWYKLEGIGFRTP